MSSTGHTRIALRFCSEYSRISPASCRIFIAKIVARRKNTYIIRFKWHVSLIITYFKHSIDDECLKKKKKKRQNTTIKRQMNGRTGSRGTRDLRRRNIKSRFFFEVNLFSYFIKCSSSSSMLNCVEGGSREKKI